MPDATYEDFCGLAGAVVAGEYPILPRPEWGQDAAFIASVIDRLRAERDQAIEQNNLMLRYNLGTDDDDPFDGAAEQKRCRMAADSLGIGDLWTAATVLYGTQSRIAQEFLRSKPSPDG